MLFRNLRLSHRIFNKNHLVSGLDKGLIELQGMKLVPKTLVSYLVPKTLVSYFAPIGTPGSGAGKGGGGGGSVRESGGGLGQYGAAKEEQFFFNKQREQLEKIKKKLKDAKSGDLTRKEEK